MQVIYPLPLARYTAVSVILGFSPLLPYYSAKVNNESFVAHRIIVLETYAALRHFYIAALRKQENII